MFGERLNLTPDELSRFGEISREKKNEAQARASFGENADRRA